ncbi:Protoporphyrinogen oxidase [Wickerhamiella sorbophila]|uniref:Protoporphyrinogen oxidase n=1 Tax=Wickerhamiella sorbophila TaxID=45607 RepID=A0A2T0FEQ3_9ASCO|nr:Protoporphyrinogen oxidase [Wickerhamiella sorbophila]PRT53473.1 Protoporphyrinogen oxidase [Wickerhamiella sorbophila]
MIGKTAVGKAAKPAGGYLGGRFIRKEKLNDEKWVKLLEVDKPPEDGLFVLRKYVKNPKLMSQEASTTRRNMPIRTLARIVKAAVKNSPKTPSKPKAAPRAPVVSVESMKDWNEITEDEETEVLKLEDLKPNGTIAVIGAGISGLSTAWLLNRARPDVKIHVFDTNEKAGGKMLTSVSESRLFESGPRTLLPSHPGTTVLLKMLWQMGKGSQVYGVPKSAATNQKALIYNGKTVQLPRSLGGAASFLSSSPIMKGLLKSFVGEPFKMARDREIDDESVASFMSRRFSKDFVDRFLSALMRGIYAADVSKLSARSVARLNRLYYLERTEHMSVVGAALSGSLSYLNDYPNKVFPLLTDAMITPERSDPAVLPDISKYSLLGFKNGIQGMAQTIADDLATRKNVSLHFGVGVTSLAPGLDKVYLTLTDGSKLEADIVNSTVADQAMFTDAIKDKTKQLKGTTLAVVNVRTAEPIAKDWFGILIPKTEDARNPEHALGIIFDSSVRNAAVSIEDEQKVPAIEGSIMTVMMGGDLWKGELTPGEAEANAAATIRKYVGDFDQSNAEFNVRVWENGIPLYEVGHSALIHDIHQATAETYNNRVILTGMALGRGVGVSDCVIDSLTVALRFSEQRKLLHPEFFFGNHTTLSAPELYA